MKKKYWIGIGLLVAVVLAVAAAILFSGDGEDKKSPEEIAREYTIANIIGDYETVFRYSADEAEYDEEFFRDQKQMTERNLANTYGDDWKITAQAVSTKDIEVSECIEQEYISVYIKLLKNTSDFDENKMTQAKIVTIETKISGNIAEDVQQVAVYVIEYNNAWKVLYLD